jgi:Meckel syndrome type 1 protein
MNEVPPDQGEANDVDDHYRRVSAADSSRPSESVRRAVLDHAAQLAAQRSFETGPVNIDITRPAANQAWRRPAIFGTLAAAALAGFMIAPQFFSPRAPDTAISRVEESQRQSTAAPTAQAPTAAQAPIVAQAPAATSQVPAAAPAVPLRAPSSQTTDQVAEMKADKRSVGGAARVAASPPVIPADNGTAGAKIDARRMQSSGSSVSSFSAGLPQKVAPMLPAPRLADLSAQLRRAAEIGDVPALQAVLGSQPVIDARDDGGRTALMLATLHGQNRAVEVLLASGADPNAADARGITPLQAAEAANQTVIVEALRRAGAR